MNIHPIDVDILKLVSTSFPLNTPRLAELQAIFWLKHYFNNTHVVLYNDVSEIKGKSLGTFHIKKGGTNMNLHVRRKDMTTVGKYAIKNGFLIMLNYNFIHLPISEWERQYVRYYNLKYDTSFITYRQAQERIESNWFKEQ